MEDVKVFVVEVLEDTEINGASYEKGRRFKFDNKIPDHIQDVIDAGAAEDITDTLTADQIAVVDQAQNPVEPVEVPVNDPKDPASEASSTPGSEANTSAPADPSAPEAPVDAPVAPEATVPGDEQTLNPVESAVAAATAGQIPAPTAPADPAAPSA